MHPITKVTPVVAVQVISKSIELAGSILQYRAGCRQLDAERERMHRKADFAENRLKAEFLSQMAQPDQLAKGYYLTIGQISQNNLNCIKALENLEISEQNLWKVYFADNVSNEHKDKALTLIEMHSKQRESLLQEHGLSDSEAILHAFGMFANKLNLNSTFGR